MYLRTIEQPNKINVTTTPEEQKEFIDKLQKALDTVYAKVVEFKKQKGTDIVIMQDGKIVHINPNTIHHIES